MSKYPLHIDIRLWYLLQNFATPISIILTNFKFITKSQIDRKSFNELILFKELRNFSRIWRKNCSLSLYRWIMIEWVCEKAVRFFRSLINTIECLEYQYHYWSISNDIKILEFERTVQFDWAPFLFIDRFFHKLMVPNFLKLSYKLLMWILLRAADTNSN